MNRQIEFCWLPNYRCNYRCPYCYFEPHWKEVVDRDKSFSKDKIISAWERIRKKYGEAQIYVSGGESTLYPDFTDIMKELSKMHRININTNLSIEVNKIINHLSPLRITLSVSFHPFFVHITDMINKLYLLRKNNWRIDVACVAWPPLVYNLDYYHSIFQGYNFKVLPFWGKYDGKDYPQSYTEEEKNLVNKYMGKRKEVTFSTNPPKVTGRLCQAGQLYAHILPDGEVLRCGFGGESMNRNFFDKEFALFDKASPCISEYCGCLEWVACEK